MRIHGMSLVKNEADVIGQSLVAATAWADEIYVYDNGSDDDTWKIVLDLGSTYPQIVPHKQETRPFGESLRRELFAQYRGDPGDWWVTLDADEFYIDDPRSFLAAIPERFGEVWSASFEYYFTDRDVVRYEQDPAAYADDVPVGDKFRYYLSNWSEPRFFRDTKRLRWDEGDAWPERLGPAYKDRIRLKHYQYRSPPQMQRRIDSRREALERSFRHELLPDWKQGILSPRDVDFAAADVSHAPTTWRDRVVEASLLTEDRGEYVVDESSLPPIPRYRPRWVRTLRAGARRARHLVTRRTD
jgi:glycosyltransferase involved in cell wall biosynthesis